jgi:Ser/Thr protein kinase RdoA (MazF antagonist)
MADTYRVSTAGEVFFFKVHMVTRRSRKDVQEEVRLLLHLLADGVGVCEPIMSVKGQYVLSIDAPEGERYAVLYRAAEGVEGTTYLHRRALGRMVALMHQSADRLYPPYERDDFELEHILGDNLESIGRLMINRTEDFELVSRIATHARELVIWSLIPQPPEHGPCHGDLHGGDVLYSPDGEPVIFDFESSGTGWRALDIAVFGGSTDWMDTSVANFF